MRINYSNALKNKVKPKYNITADGIYVESFAGVS
jgi:hypothetical protein